MKSWSRSGPTICGCRRSDTHDPRVRTAGDRLIVEAEDLACCRVRGAEAAASFGPGSVRSPIHAVKWADWVLACRTTMAVPGPSSEDPPPRSGPGSFLTDETRSPPAPPREMFDIATVRVAPPSRFPEVVRMTVEGGRIHCTRTGVRRTGWSTFRRSALRPPRSPRMTFGAGSQWKAGGLCSAQVGVRASWTTARCIRVRSWPVRAEIHRPNKRSF